MDDRDELYLAILEGNASGREIDELLASEEACQEPGFAEYRVVDKLCKLLGQEEVALDEDFTHEVVSSIVQNEESEELASLDQFLLSHGRTLVLSLSGFASTLAIVLLTLLIHSPNPYPRTQSLGLQAAHEIVQLHVLASEERAPKQESYVHVYVRFDEGEEEIDLGHFLPVVQSEQISNQAEDLMRISVEASPGVAESIRRARQIGQLRVVAVPSIREERKSQKLRERTLVDPYGRMVTEDLPGVRNAVLYLRAEREGERTRHVFENGRWHSMEETELLAF